MPDILQHEGQSKNFSNLISAAIIGLLLVLPFVILELLFNPNKQNPLDPIALFGFLWLLGTVFIFLLTPLVQSLRAGDQLAVKPVTLLLRVTVLVFIAWLWGANVIDQLPCFLGVPNCD